MSRVDKLQEELRHQVSLIIQQELRDSRIGFITVTRVELTADLRIARIFFTTIDSENTLQDTLKGLESSKGFVRKLIGERVRAKYTPELRFIYDDSSQKQERIDHIIDMLHKEKENKDGVA